MVLTALTPLMGAYLVRLFTRTPILLDRPLGALGRSLYRALRIDPTAQQVWSAYARSMLVFSGVCLAALYATLRTQDLHPLNPSGFGPGTGPNLEGKEQRFGAPGNALPWVVALEQALDGALAVGVQCRPGQRRQAAGPDYAPGRIGEQPVVALQRCDRT